MNSKWKGCIRNKSQQPEYWKLFHRLLGAPKGRVDWSASPPPPKDKLKKLCTRWCHRFNAIYPSAEIRHWNRLTTRILEYWKSAIKASEYVDICSSPVSCNCPCNLTVCRLEDFELGLEEHVSHCYVVEIPGRQFAWLLSADRKCIH